jgi:hypothetical protein
MQKLWVIISIILITWVFIYSMIYLSKINKCTWVRIYQCTKEENKDLIKWDKYIEIKKKWYDLLKECNPEIKDKGNFYSLDYSKCNIRIIK